ncbi:MAG: hypothetical protein ACE14T_09350 [Syntrophales bacterium]
MKKILLIIALQAAVSVPVLGFSDTVFSGRSDGLNIVMADSGSYSRPWGSEAPMSGPEPDMRKSLNGGATTESWCGTRDKKGDGASPSEGSAPVPGPGGREITEPEGATSESFSPTPESDSGSKQPESPEP